MNPLARIAVLITVAAVAVGAGLYLMQPARSSVGTQPSPSVTTLPSPAGATQTPMAKPPIADGLYVGRAVKISDIIASINSTPWLSTSDKADLLKAPFAQAGKSTFNAYFEIDHGAYTIGFTVDGTSEVDARATFSFLDDHTFLLQENPIGGVLRTRVAFTVEGDTVTVTLLSHEVRINIDRFIGQLLYGSGPFTRQP